MRIWHKELIPILPNQQLVGQWRECCLIAKLIKTTGSPNHVLVNKVMNYPIEHFSTFCNDVLWQMKKRGYQPGNSTIYLEYNTGLPMEHYVDTDILFDGWHNERYLYQCLSNLEEKWDCGGIPSYEWAAIDEFINDIL